ncbi:MAG: ABC transporter permease [Ruminococcaceae bacterium]|nr:ABC transporter permease [Oscillospiraceae bacterium]
MKASEYKISAEKFVFHSSGDNLHDKKLETKPVTYFRDALNRFTKNKASIVAFFIIAFLFLFAILGPIISPYQVKDEDINYAYAQPKNKLFYNLGIKFWDGGQNKEVNKATYDLYRGIQEETGRTVIMSEVTTREQTYMGKTSVLYNFRLDTYNAAGVKYVLLNEQQYADLQAFQDANNVQIILPITDPKLRPQAEQDKENANIWYRTKLGAGRKTEIIYDKEGNFIPIYKANDGKDNYTSTMYWEGDEKLYNYAEAKDGGMWKIRVDYKEYYAYINRDKGISEPLFIFGANNAGKDIFTCLASGARFSFILALIVASVNLCVGAIYGAIEGYYGGKIDLIMERIVDLLASIPFMIVITLLKYHFDASHIVILFISFFLTGWTGMAGRTRMQFYRFKNQEYVLVARTLGARDRRIMFKHIFPNAIGTLITSSVLVIPSVIFSETSLSYLGIINLSTGNMTSVGTLLATGQNYLFTYPHMILFPSLFISLLMLCFNLFGNGLRDAFNPSLRGTED